MGENLTLRQASLWASEHLGRVVTTSNISYLINYGRISKIVDGNRTFVALDELKSYYSRWQQHRRKLWESSSGDDVCWRLSFQEYKESETTKHVHRLHPYKGKFIPQLVEYFLDSNCDEFKTESIFKPLDIVLDPFCGSGTTLVQASELGIHSIGIDISFFNSMMSNLKIMHFDFTEIEKTTHSLTRILEEDKNSAKIRQFDQALAKQLSFFNNEFFLKNSIKQEIHAGKIDGILYGGEQEKLFSAKYKNLCDKYGIKVNNFSQARFLDRWFLTSVKQELLLMSKCINEIEDSPTRRLMQLILSRAMRSCRATRHADLATLKDAICAPYYCHKHGKICKPIFSILGWWKRYATDTVRRLKEYATLRQPCFQCCLIGDSRTLNIDTALSNASEELHEQFLHKKIRGIFSSPPYVGLIDYHEQHAYAYDLFNFPRRDEKEIGALCQGQGCDAQKQYVTGVAEVLCNAQKFMIDNFDIILVANDKFGLYPTIAEQASLVIFKKYVRPVINRSEGDRNAYSETIFHMKKVK